MGNKSEVKQEGGTDTGRIWTRYCYRNFNTPKKLSFENNITKLEDDVFARERPSGAAKYEDSIETLINYVWQEYSAGVYLGQATREGKVPNLALLTKPNKDNNQSDAEFDVEVFEWKENTKTVFIGRRNIEEGKKIYSWCSPKNASRPWRPNWKEQKGTIRPITHKPALNYWSSLGVLSVTCKYTYKELGLWWRPKNVYTNSFSGETRQTTTIWNNMRPTSR